jgi:methylenetetrahydrofolate reductase (NADPH)
MALTPPGTPSGSPTEDDAVGAVLRRLMAGFSVEITPREAPSLPPLADVLPAGTAVYLTFLPNTPWEQTVAVAWSVREAGMRPVPHLAARAVPDRAVLRRMLVDVAAAGADDLLVLAGSLDKPVGEFHEAAQILDSGLLEDAGIHRVGIVGHPEGHPDVDDDELFRALHAKCRIARERGLDLYLVTQFAFDAEPIVAWERRIRAAGVDVPIQVGLPGVTTPARLLRFGLRCGVGPSLKVLRQQAGGVLKLATSPVHHPDATLVGLAAVMAADPDCLLRGIHFFPFGALVPTVAWAGDIRDGRFEVDDRDRLRVTA